MLNPSVMQTICLPTRIFDRTEDLEATKARFEAIMDATADLEVADAVSDLIVALEKVIDLGRKAHVMSMVKASLEFVNATERNSNGN